MAGKAFASQGDLEEKTITFEELAEGLYAYTAEGDPNSGIIVGDESVMVVDTQATPVMAQGVIDRIRSVTDKPIEYVTLSHYHAVRVLGASAYGAQQVIASRDTYDLIVERGQQDYESEVGRFPRLFQSVESVPGLTWPNVVFEGSLTLYMGKHEVQILQLGRGHTKGDTVVWLPKEKVLFAGDLVEFGATPYTGDAYLKDWPNTLERLRALGPEKLVPGRGAALKTPAEVEDGIAGTQAFLTEMYQSVAQGVSGGKSLKDIYGETFQRLEPRFGGWVIFEHCMPFDVARAYDEASGIADPRIWTAERDLEMWRALEQG
ncbi:MBL fold metallo-hydrolase [Pelagibius sp.]|uniref:MBL fold metallo-hydrolase n=1 Tax=Pelagibius sp. TaxID=1931238 RepID=UPI00260199B1|nr:MBL fold metallo-hydrolase [Pelagibius sp.]